MLCHSLYSVVCAPYCRDPHPGNLLVTPKGELCYLDYGMMGVLPADTRTELVALLVNFVNKDEVKV